MTVEEVVEKFKTEYAAGKASDRIKNYDDQFQKNIFQVQGKDFQIQVLIFDDNKTRRYEIRHQQKLSHEQFVFDLTENKFKELKNIFFGIE